MYVCCRFKTFWEKQTRIMRNWHFQMNNLEWRVVLGVLYYTTLL